MEEKILQLIKMLEGYGLTKINLLAIVKPTRSQIIFYCDYLGKCYQSNQLLEETNFNVDIIDKFYVNVEKAIICSDEFDCSRINIIKYYSDQRFEHNFSSIKGSFLYIEKEWKKEIGLI